MVKLHNDIKELNRCLQEALGVIIHNPSVPKSNQLHIVIFRVLFINMRFIS
jgi:hypothetical protein